MIVNQHETQVCSIGLELLWRKWELLIVSEVTLHVSSLLLVWKRELFVQFLSTRVKWIILIGHEACIFKSLDHYFLHQWAYVGSNEKMPHLIGSFHHAGQNKSTQPRPTGYIQMARWFISSGLMVESHYELRGDVLMMLSVWCGEGIPILFESLGGFFIHLRGLYFFSHIYFLSFNNFNLVLILPVSGKESRYLLRI